MGPVEKKVAEIIDQALVGSPPALRAATGGTTKLSQADEIEFLYAFTLGVRRAVEHVAREIDESRGA